MFATASPSSRDGPTGAYSRHIWGARKCIRNSGNTHLLRDCRADWHFDFFPASLMLMIWLWMGDLHRVWAIWVQFRSWGWKHIDWPLMVFMGGCFHPDWDIIELSSPLMQGWFCVTVSTGVRQTFNMLHLHDVATILLHGKLIVLRIYAGIKYENSKVG